MRIKNVVNELPVHPHKRYERRKPTDITTIVIHHSATENIPGDKDIYAFARYHVKDRQWPGIGYHYVIDADGTIYKTNDNNIISYHAGKHNSYSLGVCLVGNFERTDPTTEQWKALRNLTRALMSAYNVDINHVKGHGELDEYTWKKCPSLEMDAVRNYISGKKKDSPDKHEDENGEVIS